MRTRLLSETALTVAALAIAMPAAAQVADDTDPATEQDTGNVIMVTAQRREESTTEVPISLTVRDAEQLENLGIDAIRDLHIGTPGLRIDRNGISVQPSIRGVTALDGNPGNDANVAIYVDGVYRPNPAANNIDLPDIEQVEVLKGPQGTLFGRNATGGAIRFTTLRPSFTTEGSATVGYGSFDDITAKGYLTGPIAGDTVAASLSAFYRQNDGYLDDLTDGGSSAGELESFLIRAKLLIEPSDSVEFLLAAHYSDRSDASLLGQPFNGNTAARGTEGVIIPTQPYDVASDIEPRVEAEERSISGNLTVDLGFADLNSITAYNVVDLVSPVESDYTNIPQQYFVSNTKQKTFSQEITLASNGSDAFQWVGGVFYYDDAADYRPLLVVTSGFPFEIYGRQDTKAYSAFGEVTAEVLPNLFIIGGLRYSHEERTLSGQFGTSGFPEIASQDYSSFTPRLSARYEFDSGANIYATYSEGFKSGGFSASSLNPVPFDQEELSAYEVGFKTSPYSALRASVAAFYYDYTNQQVQAATTLANGTTVGTTTNAASSEIYGIEFEGNADLTDNLSVLATASVLHARYSDFDNAFAQVPIMVNGQPCLCGNMGANVDATGNQLVRAPDFTGSITVNYARDVSIGTIDLSATVYHSSSFFFTPDNRVGQSAYETVNARIGLTTLDGNWTLAAYGRNLTDEVIFQGASILPSADGVLFAPPRQFGVEVTRRF